MICLALESTAHTASLALVNSNGRILNEIREMYTRKEGGIIPKECAEHHKKIFPELLKKISKNFNLKKINLIAFSQGPGLSPCLLEGMRFSKKLSYKLKAPLIPVNHLLSHIEIGKLLTSSNDPVSILATGANTQIIAYEKGKYRIFGECLSIALGNALDKFGRAINLGFPAGPKIEELAKKGNYVELPYVVKGMDVEFSGIITNAVDLYKKGYGKEDLCYSLQETMFAMLTEVTERALAHTNKKEALLIGGVAANKRLIEMLNIMCMERKVKFSYVPLKYSGDQAAQIGWTGILQYKHNKKYYDNLKLNDIDIKPNWRIEDVDVNWIE